MKKIRARAPALVQSRMPAELDQLLAARHGHFRLESGYHSDTWFELDRLFAAPEKLLPFIISLAQRLAGHHPQAICGPTTGGAVLAAQVARELGVTYLFTERIASPPTTGLYPVKYHLPPVLQAKARGLSVAIVDDAISAGSAVRGTLASLVAHGARPVALGALIVFGDQAARYAAEQHLPLESVTQLDFNLWSPDACPLCRAKVPLESVSDAPPANRG